jgi:hypothetical protein
MRLGRAVVASMVAVAGACGGLWHEVSFEDEGDACFEMAGENVIITVTAPGCLSGGCHRGVGGSCEAVVEGSTITLTSEIHWEERDGRCDADCGSASVTCVIPSLPAGTYTFVHGEGFATIMTPIDGVCVLM